ncbi:hypothetical protein [Roseivirga sp. UBA1976]|uniref:hypothetical protein n=1 Tax=Roseivirga sp. UBA1976 TaxID=1947386 RepID=UPI0025808DB1|nr:hypothetical protein [Roseivirga sp. UBA1976]MEC7752439.1 hypothetical protein [Bacteroidota bacterium]|tara:strand:- start:2639 stop:2866 length:228 start_codon:yes stop_codon:yes gene_type:complete
MRKNINRSLTILICSGLLTFSLAAGTCTLAVNPLNNGSCQTEYEEDEDGNMILTDAWCEKEFVVIGGYNCIVAPY